MPKLSAFQTQQEKNRAAVLDVEAVISKHGLVAVRSVVNKKSKIAATKQQLADQKRRLEGDLKKLEADLGKVNSQLQ